MSRWRLGSPSELSLRLLRERRDALFDWLLIPSAKAPIVDSRARIGPLQVRYRASSCDGAQLWNMAAAAWRSPLAAAAKERGAA